jgi:hypothetical protein
MPAQDTSSKSTTQDSTVTKVSGFEELPEELRVQIYRYYLVKVYPINRFFRRTLAIFEVNRKISNDASEVFYKENTFLVRVPQDHQWLKAIGQKHRQQLRQVILHFTRQNQEERYHAIFPLLAKCENSSMTFKISVHLLRFLLENGVLRHLRGVVGSLNLDETKRVCAAHQPLPAYNTHFFEKSVDSAKRRYDDLMEWVRWDMMEDGSLVKKGGMDVKIVNDCCCVMGSGL